MARTRTTTATPGSQLARPPGRWVAAVLAGAVMFSLGFAGQTTAVATTTIAEGTAVATTTIAEGTVVVAAKKKLPRCRVGDTLAKYRKPKHWKKTLLDHSLRLP